MASRGKQLPMMKPRATAPANTNPQGRSIDLQNTNFRLTRLAFWTDSSAIRTIHVAAIVEIIKFVIALIFRVLGRSILAIDLLFWGIQAKIVEIVKIFTKT